MFRVFFVCDSAATKKTPLDPFLILRVFLGCDAFATKKHPGPFLGGRPLRGPASFFDVQIFFASSEAQ
jgi:hypothetical protein